MRIALAQLELSASVEENLDAVKVTIARAAQDNADLVVFPEATMKAFNSGRLDAVAESSSDRFVAEVSQAAHDAGISVVVGMFRPADEVERDGKTMHRVFNSLLLAWRDEDGPGVEFYDKLHLFDAFGFRESDTVAPGNAHVVCDVPLADGSSVALGLATCRRRPGTVKWSPTPTASHEIVSHLLKVQRSGHRHLGCLFCVQRGRLWPRSVGIGPCLCRAFFADGLGVFPT